MYNDGIGFISDMDGCKALKLLVTCNDDIGFLCDEDGCKAGRNLENAQQEEDQHLRPGQVHLQQQDIGCF